MKAKKFILGLAVLALIPSAAWAAKTTYIATNHRFNFVQLKEVKAKVAAERNMTHPVLVDEQGLRSALASIKLSRSYVIKKEVDSQDVFDDSALNFLSPNLAKALSQAKDNEEIVFSFMSKQPLFILRNDRLNLGVAWMSSDGLHVRFDKLYAKVLGDTDKRGNEAEAISKSKGLRVKLEMQQGQTLGITDPEEIILDMHYNYAADQQKKQEEKPVLKNMAGDVLAAPEAGAATAGSEGQKISKESKKSKKAQKEEAKAAAAADTTAQAEAAAKAAAPTPKERLQALDQLKKDGLVTKQEYEQKRKEILKDL